MNILYVTNHESIARMSGGFINDYMNDLLFYGLYELFGSNVVDSTPIISLYKPYKDLINPRNLWGKMTAFWLIDEDKVDRTNIEDKIKNKFYDLIIYGAIQRCNDYYDLVTKHYPSNKIIVIDGNDETNIAYQYSNKHLYFKRELLIEHKNILPISFAIPESKIYKANTIKIKDYGTCIPGDKKTYIFSDEEQYYKDFRESYYGVTMKKAGWDCMRHYEILANKCIPYFINLEQCPNNILTTLPKSLILSAMELTNNEKFNENNYNDINEELFNYTKENLTTKKLAQYVIERSI